MEGRRMQGNIAGNKWLPAAAVAIAMFLAGVRQLPWEPARLHGEDRAELPASLPDTALQNTLSRKGSLTLRDATLVEAMFALRQQWQVDMVMSNSLDGEVNATFVDTSLREILDSLLISRGYGYQVVGRSIVILPLDQIGAFKPLFDSQLIPLQHGDPDELLNVAELLLSPQGKAVALQIPRGLMVLDYPDRTRLIQQRLKELDQASQKPLTAAASPPADQIGAGSVARPDGMGGSADAMAHGLAMAHALRPGRRAIGGGRAGAARLGCRAADRAHRGGSARRRNTALDALGVAGLDPASRARGGPLQR